MQSRTLALIGLMLLSSLFYFCKKETKPVEESPFFDFFNDNLIAIDTVSQSADSWEYGFVFTPLKSGRITQFGVKLPATGDFTVSLWDLSGPTPVLLRSKSVSVSVLHENSLGEIPEIALEANVKYGITVLSNSFYRITRPGNASFNFPRTIGNLRIESFNEAVNNSSQANFPATTNETRVAPCVNVIFIAD